MASSWLTTRTTRTGEKRWRVEWRSGGRESATRYGGSFRRKTDALARQRWIDGELAARRVPEFGSLDAEAARPPTLAEAAKCWQASRVDVSAATATYQRSAFNRARRLHACRIDQISAADVAELVGELHAAGQARETIRKTVTVLSMILDHAG